MNYVENIIAQRNIPSPLKGVRNASDFEKKKENIKKLISDRQFGEIPRKPEHMFVNEKDAYDRFAAGKAVRKHLEFNFEMDDKKFSFPAISVIPKNKTKCPAFICIDFDGGEANKYMPSEEIVERGFALFSFKYKDVTSDDNDFKKGVAKYLVKSRRKNNAPGKIAIWAWAAMRVMDYVQTLADVIDLDNIAVIGIGPVGLMAVAAAAIRGAANIYAVGSRKNCVELAKEYGATHIVNYRNGDIVEQIMALNGGPVDKIIIAGGDVDTFDQAIRMLKPGGRIGNVNYLGVGDYVKIPRVEWGAGMGHKTIVGGLMPGGRLRSEKLARLITAGRIHPEKMITHVFHGWDGVKEALMLMKDKPADLIKPLVIFDK